MATKVALDNALHMLAFAVWIYEYGEDRNEKEDARSFIFGINMDKLRGQTREAVDHLIHTQQSGYVEKYIDDIRNGLQVAVCVNSTAKQIVLSFRGSDEEYDWIANAKTFKSQLNGNIFVHTGFKQLINSHKKTLNTVVDELLTQYHDFSISLTGHSLGGALSTLFGYLTAVRLAEQGTTVSVISFASPRVGNYYFRQACDSCANLSITRVTFRRDVVTAMPMINYYHAGSIVLHLSGFSERVFVNYNYRSFQYSLFRCWSVRDHGTDSYWCALKKSAEKSE